jgi:prepilin-type N-terminal cleavage/methylation domain-containing protein
VGRPRGHGAFTTLELLVVVAILAILAAFGMPALLSALERSRLEAGATELVGALRRAQALAVSQGGFFRVRFDNNRYRIEQSSDGTVWPAATDTMQTVPNPGVVTNWVDLAAQYTGLTVGTPVDSAAPPHILPAVTYNSRGAFVNPGGPLLTLPANIPVQNLSGATRTVVAEFARGARAQ